MATYDPGSYAKMLQRRFDALPSKMQAKQTAVMEDIQAEALRLVSGPKVDPHEARIRRLRMTMPRLPVHVRSGELRASLQMTHSMGGGLFTSRIQFNSEHAIVLTPGGTRSMPDTGFMEALSSFGHPRMAEGLQSAFSDANKEVL